MLNSSNISANQKQASHRIDSRGNLTIQINYHSFTAMLGKQVYCFVGIERDKTTHNRVLIDSTDHTITVTRIISYRYPPSWSRPHPSKSIMQNHVAIAAQESVIWNYTTIIPCLFPIYGKQCFINYYQIRNDVSEMARRKARQGG